MPRPSPLTRRTQHEHFGLVPLEAMAAQRAVIACNSGGPTESIVDGVTGFLCEPTPAAFAAAAHRLLDDAQGERCVCAAFVIRASLTSIPRAAAERAGIAARRHVESNFSRAAFGAQLDALVRQLAA